MTPEGYAVFKRLACGRAVSGQELAESLGVTRSAVWKQVRALRGLGLEIDGRAGRGYCLAAPVTLLDPERLSGMLTGRGIAVEVHPSVGSTNAVLAAAGEAHRRAVLAEFQSAGRGRRGRHWISPPGSGICLSFGYRFECGLPQLGALSLVAGLAAAEALDASAGVRAGLKWPNDLVIDGGKLGGLLVEITGAADGPCQAVIGVGINVRLPEACLPDQPWTDLARAGVEACNRTALAAALIEGLDRACLEFEGRGFEAFAGRWAERDCLAGRRVRVCRSDGVSESGTACGVSARGALWLDRPGGRVELTAGEVSVRAG